MKPAVQIVGVLSFVCVLCGALLALVAGLVQGAIETNQQEAIRNALFSIEENISTVEEQEYQGNVVYKLFDQEGLPLGFGFIAQGQGYQGIIKIMAVVDSGWNKLIGIEIVESQETPGLGSKIAHSFFKDQFKGISLHEPINLAKGQHGKNKIVAITGATISSKAVVAILNQEISRLKTLRAQ